jgi:hypothetical protein
MHRTVRLEVVLVFLDDCVTDARSYKHAVGSLSHGLRALAEKTALPAHGWHSASKIIVGCERLEGHWAHILRRHLVRRLSRPLRDLDVLQSGRLALGRHRRVRGDAAEAGNHLAFTVGHTPLHLRRAHHPLAVGNLLPLGV